MKITFKTRANSPTVFGDARDNGDPKVCTSQGFSTMPRRERGPQNKSGYQPG